MAFKELVAESRIYFPNLQIRYKTNSPLMKLFGLFNKKDYMTHRMATFGNTIYIPSEHFLKVHPIASIVLFLHELTRFKISKKKSYLSSLYVIQKLSQTMHFTPHLDVESKNLIHRLQHHWTRSALSLEIEFEGALLNIREGQRPFEDPIFDIIDDLLKNV
jgi:hypothetical protein